MSQLLPDNSKKVADRDQQIAVPKAVSSPKFDCSILAPLSMCSRIYLILFYFHIQ